ncbi:Hexaprenyldihydroxybenzoate methyltransferase, mitochondrial [Chamberlinius hualienensis]
MSTLKPERLQYFEGKAKIWWDPNGHYRLSHFFPPLRIKLLTKNLIDKGVIRQTDDNNEKCLASTGAEVTGMDPSELLIKTANQHLATYSAHLIPNLTYITGTAEDLLKSHKEYFDVIGVFLVIEHVENKGDFLQDCVKLLKPGGSIFLQIVNKHWLTAASFLLWHTYITQICPKRVTAFSDWLDHHEMVDYINNSNCKVVDVAGVSISFNGRSARMDNLIPHFNIIHASKHL